MIKNAILVYNRVLFKYIISPKQINIFKFGFDNNKKFYYFDLAVRIRALVKKL